MSDRNSFGRLASETWLPAPGYEGRRHCARGGTAMKATPVWISGYAAMGAMVAFFNQHDWPVAMLCATTSAGFLWMARDSGRLRNGGDVQQAPCEASQSGSARTSPMTNRTNPMTTADAKVELVERILFNRTLNISHDDARRLAVQVLEALALEASPNSRTEAITPEMIEAAWNAHRAHLGISPRPFPKSRSDSRKYYEAIYTAMQAARP